MITVSYTQWGKTYKETFEPSDYAAAFAYARKLLDEDRVVTIKKN